MALTVTVWALSHPPGVKTSGILVVTVRYASLGVTVTCEIKTVRVGTTQIRGGQRENDAAEVVNTSASELSRPFGCLLGAVHRILTVAGHNCKWLR